MTFLGDPLDFFIIYCLKASLVETSQEQIKNLFLARVPPGVL